MTEKRIEQPEAAEYFLELLQERHEDEFLPAEVVREVFNLKEQFLEEFDGDIAGTFGELYELLRDEATQEEGVEQVNQVTQEFRTKVYAMLEENLCNLAKMIGSIDKVLGLQEVPIICSDEEALQAGTMELKKVLKSLPRQSVGHLIREHGLSHITALSGIAAFNVAALTSLIITISQGGPNAPLHQLLTTVSLLTGIAITDIILLSGLHLTLPGGLKGLKQRLIEKGRKMTAEEEINQSIREYNEILLQFQEKTLKNEALRELLLTRKRLHQIVEEFESIHDDTESKVGKLQDIRLLTSAQHEAAHPDDRRERLARIRRAAAGRAAHLK